MKAEACKLRINKARGIRPKYDRRRTLRVRRLFFIAKNLFSCKLVVVLPEWRTLTAEVDAARLLERMVCKGYNCSIAGVAELVDAHDSKSCLARGGGSIPLSGTKFKIMNIFPEIGVLCFMLKYLHAK